jgi:hypothetical protein
MNQLAHFQEFHRTYKDDITLQRLTQLIRDGVPVIFLKFGDGEVECMKVTDNQDPSAQVPKHNCDSDVYYPELSQVMKAAFLYFSYQSYAKRSHVYLGKWHYNPEIDYLSKLTYELHPHKPIIPFANYHLVMNDKGALKNSNMREFVRTIRNHQEYHKIIISNGQNRLLQSLFSAVSFVETPPRCLFLVFDQIAKQVSAIIDQVRQENTLPSDDLQSPKKGMHQKVLLLTSCGLSAKALVYYLYQKYCDSNESQVPFLSAIDLGSSFDLLCKKQVTRAYQYEYSYDELHQYYEEFLD